MARTAQEKLAALVSRKANKRVAFCQNQDGTIDVYVPARFVVFVVRPDLTVTWRPARNRSGEEIPSDGITAVWARGIVAKSRIEGVTQ